MRRSGKILNGVSTNGGGQVTFRVIGMGGIYYFCGAVILSIILSLAVDLLDFRTKTFEQKSEQQRWGSAGYRERGGLLLGERPVRHLMYAGIDGHDNVNNDGEDVNNNVNAFTNDELEMPLLHERGSNLHTSFLEIEVTGEGETGGYVASACPSVYRGSSSNLFSVCFLFFSLLCPICVFVAARVYTMERLVFGAGPTLMHNILGVDWEKSYSFQTLMWTTGAAKGCDYMLMGTFGLFCVLGPVLRSVLLFFTIALDQCRGVSVSDLAIIVQFMGSFCAWEVCVIATVMVKMLMPSITDTIIRNQACATISDDGSCLKMEFNLIPVQFSYIIFGGTSLVILSKITCDRVIAKQNNSLEEDLRVTILQHDYERLQMFNDDGLDDDGGRRNELMFETNQ